MLELTKPGIVRMVTMTAAVGFALAAIVRGAADRPAGSILVAALWCVVGTALSAAGANALNQSMEARRDGRMVRTRNRPIPAGRMTLGQGWVIGAVLAVVGVGALGYGTNVAAAGVSLATVISYVLLYTPLKPVTPLAMWVGAVPGALPPLIGWAAASDGPWRGLDHPGGWSLFAIMFAWQIPHFLALAWKYREDYAAGGFRVLSIGDRTGVRTAWHSVLWSLLLIAASISPVLAVGRHVGWMYAIAAVMLGCGMLWLSLTLLAERSDRNARRLFLGSVAYLPLVLFVMVGDAVRGLLG